MFKDSDEESLGIFEDHDQIRHMRELRVKQSEDGLVVQRACEKCQVDMTALIPWEELYCVSKGVMPQRVHPKYAESPWIYNAQHATMFPKITCPSCNAIVPFPVSPHDAAKRVQQASEGNVMSQAQRAACTQLAKAFQSKSAALQQAANQPQRR